MIGELDFFGVFFPALLPLAILAFTIALPTRMVFRRMGFYRLIWHAGLFDAAMYVITLWALVAATGKVAP